MHRQSIDKDTNDRSHKYVRKIRIFMQTGGIKKHCPHSHLINDLTPKIRKCQQLEKIHQFVRENFKTKSEQASSISSTEPIH